MVENLRLVLSIGLWVTVCWRLLLLRKQATQLALFGTLLAVSLSATLDLPRVSHSLDHALGVVNLAQLAKHMLMIAAAGCAWVIVDSVSLGSQRPRGPRMWAAPLAAEGGLLLAFLASPVHHTEVRNFSTDLPSAPATAAYWAVLCASMMAVFVHIAATGLRLWRSYPPGGVRRGNACFVIGGGTGCLYIVHKAILQVLLARHGPREVGPGTRIQELLIVVCLGSLVAGAALTAAGASHLGQQLRAYRRLRQLLPLWVLVSELAPHLVLREPGRPRFPRLDTAEEQLYECWVETRDGVLVAQSLLPMPASSVAARLADLGFHPSPALTAAVLLQACHLQRAPGPGVVTTFDERLISFPDDQADFDTEVDALARVARCLRQARPLAPVILDQTDTRRDTRLGLGH